MQQRQQNLLNYLDEHPEKHSEAMKFMVDFMASDNQFVVNPEEGLMAMESDNEVPRCSSEMYRDYLRIQNEFFVNYWRTHIAPVMSPSALAHFLRACGQIDLSENFEDACLKKLQSTNSSTTN